MRIFLALFVIIVLSSIVSADGDFGSIRINEPITLLQSCSNETSACDLCNLTSVKYQNSSVFISNQRFTKNESLFNYTVPGIFNIISGEYTVYGFCRAGTLVEPFVGTYDVSPTGYTLGIGNSLVYFVLFSILSLLFLLGLLGSVKIPFRNSRNDNGTISSLNFLKYAKITLAFVTYLLAIGIMYLSWQISYAFLFENILTGIFKALFFGMVIFLLPVFILFIIVSFIVFVQDMRLKNLIERGLNPR